MKLNKNKFKNGYLAILIICLFTGNIFCKDISASSASKNNVYTISPTSKPIDKSINYRAYNENTKHYYLIYSYLQKFEKDGGGTLILKKGTYSISNTLAVPSNVTIQLNDGVVIKKGTKTGTTEFPASMSIFQFIRPAKLKTKNAVSKYNGEKNISIIGKGTAIIDLDYINQAVGIVAGHNKNITIDNISFKNLNSGHFIEADAIDGLDILNCKFVNSKASEKLNKEAINLDTPDLLTKGFNNIWSAHDKTPNRNVVIKDNYFENLDRAIGTHKYSQNKDKNGKYTVNIYHTNISITGNTITKTRSDAIRVLNWKNTIIEDNEISNITVNSSTYRAILAGGAINLTIKNNIFKDVSRPVQIFPTKNTGDGSEYSITYNKLTKQNISDLENNTVINVSESFARISEEYNVFSNALQVQMKSE